MSRGARPNVLNAMGLLHHRLGSDLHGVLPGQHAACRVCGERLEFGTDEIGRSTERCSSERCSNREPQPLQAEDVLPDTKPRASRAKPKH